ncbi:MAG: AAA family ATPase, partial [Clostridia bacterium]|nr:AAA family ATPase [Clostridia bacterium]
RLKANKADDEQIKSSLLMLLRMMHAHYGKPVILLIDEYDVPLAKANEEKASGERYYPQMLEVIRSIMSTALKSNDYLKFAVVTVSAFAKTVQSDREILYKKTEIRGGRVKARMDIIPAAPTVDLITPTEAKTVLAESPRIFPITGIKVPEASFIPLNASLSADCAITLLTPITNPKHTKMNDSATVTVFFIIEHTDVISIPPGSAAVRTKANPIFRTGIIRSLVSISVKDRNRYDDAEALTAEFTQPEREYRVAATGISAFVYVLTAESDDRTYLNILLSREKRASEITAAEIKSQADDNALFSEIKEKFLRTDDTTIRPAIAPKALSAPFIPE